MVCADEQIHSEETKLLQDLAQNANIATQTIEEMEKILSQDENLIPVKDVARQIPAGEQSEAIQQILAIAHVDGYFSPLEREMVEQVAEIWNWSYPEIQRVLEEDSIQESEFQFLQLLKAKAKPLIILLNIKNNLRDARRLEHFLKDPDKLFLMDTKSGLAGHIERIRRYAKQHYANDYFDIIPVMLLAAQMSKEAEHQKNQDKLFKASHIQEFLNAIRVSLVEHGIIRRSQTLLGSTVSAIDKPNKWVTQQAQIYQELTETLKNKRESVRKDIRKAARHNSESLQQKIEVIFQDTFNIIPDFAEEHWDANEIGLKLGWEKKLKSIKEEENAISSSNIWVKQLAEIRQDFDLILRYITKATENPVI
jgi:uncharacterized tellurite resistance protein B-like protein